MNGLMQRPVLTCVIDRLDDKYKGQNWPTVQTIKAERHTAVAVSTWGPQQANQNRQKDELINFTQTLPKNDEIDHGSELNLCQMGRAQAPRRRATRPVDSRWSADKRSVARRQRHRSEGSLDDPLALHRLIRSTRYTGFFTYEKSARNFQLFKKSNFDV